MKLKISVSFTVVFVRKKLNIFRIEIRKIRNLECKGVFLKETLSAVVPQVDAIAVFNSDSTHASGHYNLTSTRVFYIWFIFTENMR